VLVTDTSHKTKLGLQSMNSNLSSKALASSLGCLPQQPADNLYISIRCLLCGSACRAKEQIRAKPLQASRKNIGRQQRAVRDDQAPLIHDGPATADGRAQLGSQSAWTGSSAACGSAAPRNAALVRGTSRAEAPAVQMWCVRL